LLDVFSCIGSWTENKKDDIHSFTQSIMQDIVEGKY